MVGRGTALSVEKEWGCEVPICLLISYDAFGFFQSKVNIPTEKEMGKSTWLTERV